MSASVGISRRVSRHRSRMLDVQVAPPEDRLDPLELREPPMEAQHRSKLRVHASLDPVVRGRKRPFGRERGVQVREQGAGVGEPHQPRPRAPQPLVRVNRAPVDHAALLQEIGPEAAPLPEALEPPFGLREGLYMQQLLGQAVQLDARLQLRPRRGLPLDLAERVEHASLHLRGGPLRRDGGREAAAAVGHHHLRRGHARQKRPPRRGGLGAREVPRQQHELVAAGYQHHAVARHPYAVDVDDAAGLVYGLRHRPYRPEPRAPAPERAALPGHIDLGFLGKQPADEGGQVARRGVDGMGRAGPAADAAPTLRAGLGLSVALHGRPAGRACHIIHGNLRKSATFCHDIRHATCGNVNFKTHFLSERESRFV